MFNRVFVLDTNKNPLTPCHPARARELLKKGEASVFRRFPFTIILKYSVENNNTLPVEVKYDPGSKNTDIVLTLKRYDKNEVIWSEELRHKGIYIKEKLDNRRILRRSRRNRKTRYRKARFLNRRNKKEWWLPPSLISRIDNIISWTSRFNRWCKLGSISMELVKFDTQKLDNPEIKGSEYQQGTLFGYEIREYLLEKYNHTCAYCGAKDVPLEIDHIVSRSKGGTNRISNLTIACKNCNRKKSNMPIEIFLKDKPLVLKKILSQTKISLKDATTVNSTRWALYNKLKEFNLPINTGSGGLTKYNRISQGYPKKHWIDAACVGSSGSNIKLNPNMIPLTIKAMGRGSR